MNRQLVEEFASWNIRRLEDLDLVFSWADGVYLGAGPDDERRVFLAGRRSQRLQATCPLARGHEREARAWEDLFADLAARGLRPPELIVADGAEGLWSAVSKAWPGVAQQRCWLYKIRNVEEKLPKERQRAVHTDLSEAMHAETAPLARAKLDRLAKSYERRYSRQPLASATTTSGS